MKNREKMMELTENEQLIDLGCILNLDITIEIYDI